MGTPVPILIEVLEADKWYKIGTDQYWGHPPIGCDDAFYQQTDECCVLGFDVQNWIDNEDDCGGPGGLCFIDPWSVERLKYIHGPYDNQGDCQADL